MISYILIWHDYSLTTYVNFNKKTNLTCQLQLSIDLTWISIKRDLSPKPPGRTKPNWQYIRLFQKCYCNKSSGDLRALNPIVWKTYCNWTKLILCVAKNHSFKFNSLLFTDIINSICLFTILLAILVAIQTTFRLQEFRSWDCVLATVV